jgi:acetyltransferase-like isoleucine patch superfamily enzyme
VVLGGSNLPDYSVLSACSLLNKSFDEPYMLYGGVPAKPIKSIPKEAGYFTRQIGFIV